MARLFFCFCIIAVALVALGIDSSPVPTHREKRFIYYYPPGSNTTMIADPNNFAQIWQTWLTGVWEVMVALANMLFQIQALLVAQQRLVKGMVYNAIKGVREKTHVGTHIPHTFPEKLNNQNYTLTYVPLGRLLFGGGTFRLG